jgi:fimbrial isopeptide formation D2 family protein/uncharacterized repeat protein (TIGR01451 family)
MGFGWSNAVYAEGSVDLIRENPTNPRSDGARPYLDYRNDPTGNIPRTTIIKVYAEQGETINLGSSAMAYGLGGGAGDIQFRSPDGTSGNCSSADPETGFIRNIDQERAGSGTGYTPCTINVGAGQTGVWEIDFVSPTQTSPIDPPPTGANAPWTQPTNVGYVAAWDVTVRDETQTVIPGRAYANYMALNMGSNNVGLNSIAFILTDQGYLYRVDLNGLDPYGFIFFANSKGFTDSPCPGGNPLYSSVPIFPVPGNICIPAEADSPLTNDITYKIFFNAPSSDLPTEASVPPSLTDPDGFTWLRRIPPPIPTTSNFAFQGREGTPGQAGSDPSLTLGGTFSFDASSPGFYSIVIDVNRNGTFGDSPDVVLQDRITQVNAGPITRAWNGTDRNGNPLPAGFTPYVSELSFYVGDVHFPFLDPENNREGLVIERVDPTNPTLPSVNSIVYYNDTELQTIGVPTSPIAALGGVDSLRPTRGARGFDGGFGDNNGIDTWTSLVNPITLTGGILIQKADLSITKTDNPDPVAVGDAISYTLTVTSNPSVAPDIYSNVAGARVTDTVPPEITGVSWSCAVTSGIGACGTASGTGNTIDLTVDLNVEATATITVNGTVSSAGSGTLTNTANVGRPPDVFDPNLTNNTDNENTTITASPVQPVGTKSARLLTDTDGSGSVTAGDIIEYTVTYSNQQPDIDITDFLATDRLDPNNLSLVAGSYSLTATGAQTTITANPNFNGTTNTNLNTAGTLGRGGGQVVIRYQAQITAPVGTQISNQATATSNGGTVPLSITDALQGAGDLPQTSDDGTNQGNLPSTGDDEPTLITVGNPTPNPIQPVGTKSARLLTDRDNTGSVTPGDIIEYTVTYTNAQPGTDITDFLATDRLDPNNLSLVAGSYSLTATGAQTTITANPNFNGTSNTNLNTAGTLGRGGGQVVIKYQAQIIAPAGTQISNQATATSNGGTVPVSITDALQGAGDLPQTSDDGTNQGNLPSTGDDEPTLITVGNPTPNPIQPVGTKSARLLTDRDNTGSVTAGDIIEYTVTYTNAQPGTDITDFLATDRLDPNNLSLVAGSYSLTATGAQTTITANPNFNGTSNTNLNTAGTLGRGGGQVVIRYQAQITAPPGTQISNQATATSNGGTVPVSITDALQGAGDLPQTSDDGTNQGNLPSTGDDEPTLITVGNPTPNPIQPVGTKSARLLTDSDGSGSVTAGDIIEYTVTYSNQTPDTDITNFLASDRLEPSQVSFVSGSYSLTATGAQTTITANPNFNGTSNTNLNTAGTLGRGGGQVVIKYQAQIIAPAGTQISNQASATSIGGTVNLSLTDAVQDTGDLPQTGDNGIDQGNLPSTGDDEPTLITVGNSTPNPVQPFGTKSARIFTDTDQSGSVTAGDIIEYTVTYTNQQPDTNVIDFLATDSLDRNNLSFVPGSYSLTATGAQTTITPNPNFNGTTNTNLNTPGTLGRGGGQVVIKYQAQITAAPGTQISNQAEATSNGGTVPLSRTDAVQGLGGLPQLGDDGTNQGNLPDSRDDDATLITVSASGPARLRLVKRITTVTRGGVPISGFNFSSFVDDPNDDNDTAAGWSQLPTDAPVGAVTLGSQATLQSGDEVEYTVYFLSDGSQTSQNIKFCDPIPTGTTFIADSFGSGRGILLNRGGTQTPQTNDADTDSGAFFSPLTAVTTPPCSDSNNPNGSVFLEMGDIPNTAPSNVGFVRFRVRID